MRCVCVVVCLLTCLCSRTLCIDGDYDYESPNDDRFEDDYLIPVIGHGIFDEDPTENVIPSVEPPEGWFLGHPPDSSDDSSNPDLSIFTIETLNEKVNTLITEVKLQQNKITDLENINKNLQEKIDLLEQQIKTNSIILFNVTENRHESHRATLQKVLHVINRIMKVRVNADDISVALRGGSNSTQHRPIVVSFTNFATKMRVLGARNKLSHTNIRVAGDYSEQVAKRRSELLPYMYRLREQGNNAFFLYDKLVVNGKVKTLEELQADENTAESSQSPDKEVEVIDIYE